MGVYPDLYILFTCSWGRSRFSLNWAGPRLDPQKIGMGVLWPRRGNDWLHCRAGHLVKPHLLVFFSLRGYLLSGGGLTGPLHKHGEVGKMAFCSSTFVNPLIIKAGLETSEAATGACSLGRSKRGGKQDIFQHGGNPLPGIFFHLQLSDPTAPTKYICLARNA